MHAENQRRLAAPGLAVLTLAAALAAPVCPAFAAGAEAPLASGRVHYRMTAPVMNGTIVLSWIDHGRKFRQDSSMAIGSTAKKSQLQTWSLGDGTYLYSHQPAMGKQVMRLKAPKGAAGGPMGATPFVGGAGTAVGKARLLGRPCDIRVLGAASPGRQLKMWVWKGLPLRTEMALPQGGQMIIEATRIDTAPKLAPALFQVPAGYQVRDFQPPPRRSGSPALPPR